MAHSTVPRFASADAFIAFLTAAIPNPPEETELADPDDLTRKYWRSEDRQTDMGAVRHLVGAGNPRGEVSG